MLVAHMADVHLGARKYGERAIYEDIFEAFDLSLEELKRDRPGVLVIAGDLFDSPHPDNSTLRHAIETFKELTSAGVKVVAAHGEHDTPGRKESSTLSIMSAAVEGFRAPELRSNDLSRVVGDLTIRVNNVQFMIYPFVKVSLEQRRELAKNLLPMYQVAAQRFRTDGLKTVFVAHFSVDPIFSHDSVAHISQLPAVDYVALGHIHHRCVNCVGTKTLRFKAYAYPGSLYPLDVSEVERQRSAGFSRGPLLVDLSADEPSIQEVKVDVRRHEIADVYIKGPDAVERSIRAAVSDIKGGQPKKPIVHLRVKASVSVSTRLIESWANRLSSELGLIILPHIERVVEGVANAKVSVFQAQGPADTLSLLRGLGADEYTAKVLKEFLEEQLSDVDDEKIDELLEKLSSWDSSLKFLRSMAK